MMTPTRLLATFVLHALAVAGVLACGDVTTAAAGGATGTWILQAANGKALPYLQQSAGGGNVYVTNDTLIVSSGTSFTEHGVRKSGASPTALVSYDTYAYTGAYTAASNALTFAFQGGATGTGTLSGDLLNVTFNGTAYTYQRKSALASP
jgi:hypothetical protein